MRAGTSELHLASLEQSLLYLLADNAGRLVTREEILDALWGTDYVAESNVVDRQIRNLRARLQNDWRQPRFIATIPGRGYRFLPNVHQRRPRRRRVNGRPQRGPGLQLADRLHRLDDPPHVQQVGLLAEQLPDHASRPAQAGSNLPRLPS